MNNHELQILCNHISQKYFKRPFMHQISFNNRLKKAGGNYSPTTHNITVNPHVIINCDDYTPLLQTIRHELCHYHLGVNGKDPRHGSNDFKELMRTVNAVRFLTDDFTTKKYHYKCTKCHASFVRNEFLFTPMHSCHDCNGSIEEIPEDQVKLKMLLKQPHPKTLEMNLNQLLQIA